MKRKKQWSLLLSIVLLLTAVAGGTLAFVAVKTLSVENQFESAYVTCKVLVEGNTIKVENTSNVDAYIRAAIVVNWMDSTGNVLGTAPIKTTEENPGNYAFTVNGVKWKQDPSTQFYYYVDRVAANGGTTEALLDNITVNKPTGYDEYELSVEVIAEAIQADGVTDDTKTPAVQDAWFNPLTDGGRAILNAWGITPTGN